MPKIKNYARTKSQTSSKAVPEWAKKVKALREEAGNTQLDLQKAMKLKVNTMSLVETGRRVFTAEERKLFFELIGQPEDTSIPTKDSEPKSPGRKKSAPSAKPEAKPRIQVAKSAKPAVSAKVAKAAKTSKKSKVSDLVISTPAAEAKTHSASPAPRPRRGRKPSKPTVSVVVPASVPKPTGISKPQKSVTIPVPSAPAQSAPTKTAAAALSPIKQAVLSDITRILGNPSLSDNHAKQLHGLFTSLAVNALMGE